MEWSVSHRTPRSLVDKFFHGLSEKLRGIFKFLRKEPESRKGNFEGFMEALLYGADKKGFRPQYSIPGTAKTYSDFVQDLVQAEVLPPGRGGYNNYTPEQFLQSFPKNYERAKNWGAEKPILGTVGKTLAAAGKLGVYVKTTGHSMRALGKVTTRVAMQWHILPGDTNEPKTMRRSRSTLEGYETDRVDFMTIPAEMRMRKKRVEPAMARLLEVLPVYRGLNKAKRAKAAADYKRIAKELLDYTTGKFGVDPAGALSSLSPEAAAVVKYFDMLYNETGVHIKRRNMYYPLSIDKNAWGAKKVEIIKAIVKHQNVSLDVANRMHTDIAKRHVFTSEGVQDLEIFGSSVQAKKARSFSPETERALVDLDVYSSDIHTSVAQYTHQIIKRDVEQSRFGAYLRDEKGNYVTETVNGGERRVWAPMHLLEQTLEEAVRADGLVAGSGVSATDMKRVTEKYLPALRGTLGSSIDPTWKAFSNWTQTGLNLALLPLSVLSALSDLSGIPVRRETYKRPFEMLKDMARVARYFTDKEHREELQRLGRLMGTVTDRAIDHVLADSAMSDFASPTTKFLNEKFFEMNQLKRWTDFSRLLALDFARDSLVSYQNRLKNGDASVKKELGQLSLTEEQLLAWDGVSEGSQSIQIAVDRWVDQAVLRPEASDRPPVGSDPRAALFFHLKGFMYTFYNTLMTRTYQQMKDEKGFARAVPAIALAAFVLPLAAAGYELRKLLAEELVGKLIGSKPKYRKPEGWSYLEEMMVRGSLLGPFTIIHDMYEQEKHGSLALTALGGPAFAKTVEFLDDDFSIWLSGMIPGVAQSRVLRDEFKFIFPPSAPH
jgi:hypothetical protein